MKIDAHQHFWIYNSTEYSWINDSMNVLKRNFLPQDLLIEINNASFDGTIAVQARQTINETKWLLKLADEYDFIKGVVGWVDLCSADELKKQLDGFCKSPKFVGVRHVVQDEPDLNFMLRDEFLNGLSILKDYNLTYDLLLFPKHLQVANKVVKMFPEQKFVLDHIAKPFIKNKVIDPWHEDILKLAENKNVGCKLSGMVTEADWQNWSASDFYPYLNIIFEAFGTDRLMIGSDWPVCTLAGNYSAILNIVIDYLNDFNAIDKEKILGSNALNFYNL
jgi:L-fuconolactonase